MAGKEAHYVLFHNVSSICSIMVRYCYVLRGAPKDPQQEVRIREESVDIFHEEQLTEHYLCDINPFGEVSLHLTHLLLKDFDVSVMQVPVLAQLPLKAGDTIPDSLKITLYLSRYYPRMIPQSHYDEISTLLSELHAINYYSLTFTGKPETVQGIQEALRNRLNRQISERYRKAIDFKLAQSVDAMGVVS